MREKIGIKRKDNPLISVIVPTYNSEKTIEKCLYSIFSNTFKKVEVLVVDDCSTDSTVKIVSKFNCELIRLKTNSGPAAARNEGSKKAKADILFFVDSDIILNKNTLKIAYDFYKKEKKAVCVIGMYAKEPANKNWFNYYMAYWKYHTWTHPLPKYFSFFIASVGTIKRDVFLKLGGFQTKYEGADVEDYDFGYRLTRKHKIYFNPNIQGKHHFPSFRNCIKNYFKRSILWFELFMERKKFDTGAATASRGLSSLSTIFFLLSLFLGLMDPYLFIIPAIFLIYYLTSNIKFFLTVLREKGISLMLLSIVTNFILSVVISLGVFVSIIRYYIK